MTQQTGFKTIDGFPKYKIDKHGNIYSLYKGRIIVPNYSGKKAIICLYEKGKKYAMQVHRLVAKHFVHNPNPEKYPIINHIDGNGFNNDASNLEWCTHKHNIRHSWDNGLSKMTKDKRSRISKTMGGSDIATYHNGKLIGLFNTYKECARKINVSATSISDCFNGRISQVKGFTFQKVHNLKQSK